MCTVCNGKACFLIILSSGSLVDDGSSVLPIWLYICLVSCRKEIEAIMNANVLISVIVPVYNENRYLKQCVASIRNQTYSNLEIILVDDGSTNEAAIMCDIMARSDNRIRVIHKKNEGLSAAKYDGFLLARGDWIMFVDDDDLISPYMLATFIEQVVDNEQIDIVTGGREDLTCPDAYLWKKEKCDTYILSGKETCTKIAEDHQKTIVTPMWGKIYRKSFLESFDFLSCRAICPTIFFEDVLVTPIIYYNARLVSIVRGVFYLHREVPTSISRSMKLSPFFYEQIDSGKILLDFFKSVSLYNMYDWQLDNYYRTILRLYCLIDYEQLDKDYANGLKQKIIKNYNECYGDYFSAKGIGIIRKICVLAFKWNRYLWKKTVQILYYKKHRCL